MIKRRRHKRYVYYTLFQFFDGAVIRARRYLEFYSGVQAAEVVQHVEKKVVQSRNGAAYVNSPFSS